MWWLWCGEHRAEIATSLGAEAKAPAIAKEGGVRWKALGAEAKAPYLDRSKTMKDELLAVKPIGLG